MVFSSHIFVFYFLLLSLTLYYGVPKAWRHTVLTCLGYVFYGWWNPWFTLLMFGTTVLDYNLGKLIIRPGATPQWRKMAVFFSVLSNLSVLGFFKYCGFAVAAAGDVAEALGGTGFDPPQWVTRIVLPVGISFYVFQSMSYCIDLYRGHAVPAKNLGDFACYVALYPHLVAGPIVRYGSIADQLRHREHTIEGFVMGLSRFCMGFSKKILLADPMGELADAAFDTAPGSLTQLTAWLGVLAYAFQIYFDFSGYSDMAIGLGRMLGFRFVENFNSPYRSTSLTDFWRRWHMSLSKFLRDYLYVPLGGNRKGYARTCVNLMVVMVIGGLWHGANWTFLIWGALHGGVLVLERICGAFLKPGRVGRFIGMIYTFGIVLVGWAFFRADHLEVAQRFLRHMFRLPEFARDWMPRSWWPEPPTDGARILHAQMTHRGNLIYFGICAAIIWFVPNSQKLLQRLTAWKVLICILLFVIALTVMFAQGYSPFLYLQF